MVRSTEQRIRDEAGLNGNADISTTTIETYQLQAYNVILGMVGAKYDITELTASALFTDSQAESYLARIEELMAAGYILRREFGAEDEDQKGKGGTKLKDAQNLINALMSDKYPVRLYDVNGSEISRVVLSGA